MVSLWHVALEHVTSSGRTVLDLSGFPYASMHVFVTGRGSRYPENTDSTMYSTQVGKFFPPFSFLGIMTD